MNFYYDKFCYLIKNWWIKRVRVKYPWIRIDNHLAFYGAILGFTGTLIATVDRFPTTHQYISTFSKWRNIDEALANLQNVEHPDDQHIIPDITEGKPGFDDLVHIIKLNRPDLANEKIDGIFTETTVGFGNDLDIRILCVGLEQWSILDGFKKEAKPIAFELQFFDWVSTYRQRYFLSIGIFVAGIGFLLGVLSRLRLVRNSI
jgi:hypothetical protein